MEEKRRSTRKCTISDLRLSFTDYFIEVHDEETFDLMGRLLDISSDGMKLTSEWPIAESCVYRCQMFLPDAVGGRESISFRARSVWSQLDDHNASYRTGFEFTEFSDEDREVLGNSSNSFLFQE